MTDIGLGFAETVTRHVWTGVTTDDAGNEIPVFGLDVELEDTIVAPNVSSETETGAPVITAGLTIIWLGKVDVSGRDEFTVRTGRYRVDGDPGWLHNPHVGEDVTQLQLLRRT